ncbi:hypothetical protein [Archangium sp.]|jgi:hypothetical protein|uniref:hypothetical protein n=1 Tax=Archangium sp. TaxID=1872627 RepID=UPI002ED99D8F
MLPSSLAKPLALLLLALGSAAGGAYAYHRYISADYEQRLAEYERQLKGQLRPDEQKMQAFNAELGVARAQLKTQAELVKQYEAQLQAKDQEFEKFRREHKLQVSSLSNSLHGAQSTDTEGTGQVRRPVRCRSLEPAPAPANSATTPVNPGTTPATAPEEKIDYRYGQETSRAYLYDPDINTTGGEVLKLNQFFQVKGTVFKQENGSLKTERVELIEVKKKEDGTFEALTDSTIQTVNATFDYENEPEKVVPPEEGLKFGPNLMATLGSSFRSEGPLRFGASTRLVKLKDFGLAVGGSSDFKSLEGTGGDAFVTYQPRLGKRELGLVMGAGVHAPIGGTERVRPNVTLSFVVF